MPPSATYTHQKPENALRRSLELQSISQPSLALSTLHDTLSSRRARTWSPIYETIMKSYIDLCIDLNKPREMKDGLHQYRNLTMSQAPGSLEVVIRYLMEKSESRCKEAKESLEQEGAGVVDESFVVVDTVNDASATTDATTNTTTSIMNNNDNLEDGDNGDVDDDDNEEEDISAIDLTNMLLLSTMTSNPQQNQKESTLLLPRIKFLWEVYRAVLDILKSNSKLERLYHDTSINALEFCMVYKRRMEFRRLSDLLRMHLQNLQKYGGIAAMARVSEGGKQNNKIRGWEGWTTESIELQLQIRFKQLDTASSLHLYTEGFKTVEDIFNILQISNSRRKLTGVGTGTPKAKIMAAYYEKLTTLFWVSENYLFHAFAWYKFYTLCREYNRGMTPEQKRIQASAVLLSALCIPSAPTSSAEEDGSHKIKSSQHDTFTKEKTIRMATLLGFHTRNPTREALLSDIRAKNVMADVPEYLRQLYAVLEEDCNPLVLVQKAKPLLDQLRTEIGNSENDSIEGTLSAYVDPLISVLLLKLMYALSKSYHNISLDHIKSLTDGLGVSFAQIEKAIISAASGAASLNVRIDHRANCLRFGDLSSGEGVQLESDTMRSQLTVLSKQLSKVCNVISPPDYESIATERKALYMEVRESVNQEHADMLARKEVIEKRKEEAERQLQEKIKEEEKKKAEAEAHARAEEERRLVREQQLREKEKQEKIKKELELSEKKNYLKAMGRNVDAMSEAELENVDVDALAKEHAAKAAKKKDDAERKVREVQKRLDYIVRAIRIEEVPLIKKQYEEKVKTERARYEADVVKKAERAKLQWQEDCKAKTDLKAFNVFGSMKEFEKAAMAGRIVAHKAACAEEDMNAERIAEKAKMQRARKRKEAEIRAKKEEEERQKREEEAKKAEEEKRRREEERRRKEAEQEEIRKKKEAERSSMQRERDSESNMSAAPASKDLDNATSGSGKYVPPSRRSGGNRWGDSGSRGGTNAWGNSSSSRSSYGGGRYEGRSGDRGGYGDRDRAGGDRYRDSRGMDGDRSRREKW